MFFLIFLELHFLDLCVDMAESFSKWLLTKKSITCEEKYFSSQKNLSQVRKNIFFTDQINAIQEKLKKHSVAIIV